MSELQPIATNSAARSKWVNEKALGQLKDVFPIVTNKYTVRLKKMSLTNKNYSITEQKNAILSGTSLMNPVHVDIEIVDNNTNKVVESIDRFKLADIPFLTNRLTMILDGNDYSPINQIRLKPAAYTRKRENNVVESMFNLAKGRNFRVSMNPSDGIFNMEIGTSKVPLYPVLKSMGINDKQLETNWGTDLVDRNRSKAKNPDVALTKLYGNLMPIKEEDKYLTTTEKANKIIKYFDNTVMDPDVNAKTLGHRTSKVTPLSLLSSSKKILNVLNEKEDSDDRDNLAYQTVHTIDDNIQENIAKTTREIQNKIKFKMDSLPKGRPLSSAIPVNVFGKNIKKLLTTTSMAAPLPQINPVDIMNSAYEITSLGPGGIKDVRMVRPETRQVNSSHIGIIDPVYTKENEKAGIVLATTPNTFRDRSGNIFTEIRNVKTGRTEKVPAASLESKVIAFPGQDLSRPNILVEVIYKGRVQKMPASRVEYQHDHPSNLFSHVSNSIPFINSSSGNRVLMADKHIAHAIPLKYREEPLIQSLSKTPFKTQERLMASFILPKSKVEGVVSKIGKDFIEIKDKDGNVQTDVYESNFPLNQKTYLDTIPTVKKGDKVSPNQFLGESIYTKNGSLALGKNLNVGYATYKGLNINDGVVVSESAAKKLTSLHMNKFIYNPDDTHFVSKSKFTALFPNKFSINQLKNVKDNGVVAEGSILNEGDAVILGIMKTELSAEESLLGKVHRKLYKPYREDSVSWDHPYPGRVTDVSVSGRQITVLIKSEQPAQVGDKLSQRFASKGVITAIVKDDEMLQNESGEPLDVLVSPTAIISRQNPGQILETSLAKVAKKIGKPIAVDNFGIKDNHAFVSDMMKKYGVKDKETLFDPKNNRYIPNIMTGPQYFLKQSNQVDTGFSARSFGSYDSNERPLKGSDQGAKTIGMLDINTLLSHNSRNILQEASTIKGTKNKEFWEAYQKGLPLPTPKTPFAYDKLIGLMQGAGININKIDNKLIASPLTDREIDRWSSGEIKKPYTVRAKDLKPEKNGLFDPNMTGGPSGKKWSHIQLTEPVINPIMKKPVQTLLGYTTSALDNRIKTDGVKGIQKDLKKIDVNNRIREIQSKISTLRGANLDKAIKELKYLKALQKEKLTPDKAYILNKIPVIPPIMRPIVKLPGNKDLQVSSVNRLYSDIIHTNDAMKMLKGKVDPSDLGNLRMTQQQSVDAMVGIADSPNKKLQKQGIKGILTTIAGDIPKEGYFQSRVLSKAQDLAGRGVIIPDPRLPMDHVGVPEDMLWETMKPMIIRRLTKKGYPSTTAIQMVRDKSPIAKNELIAETKERPILINRAPSLHKHNFIGAYAIPTKKKSITLSPFGEKGLGGDYDGDAVQLHVPVSHAAVREAKNMTLPNILFTDKTKENNLIAKPEMDTNYGIYKGLNAPAKGKSVTFNNFNQVNGAYKRGEISLNDTIKIK